MKRKIYICTLLVGLSLILVPIAVRAEVLAPGETLGGTPLSAPDKEDGRYLGLTGKDDFSIKDIDADAILIEYFNMFCPHCQANAPDTVALFEMIEADEDLSGSLKIIGIGVKNSDYEVNYFRNEYDIPFPMFSDKTGAFMSDAGVSLTPTYMLVSRDDSGEMVVVFVQVGKFDDPAEFLEVIRQHLADR